MPSPDDVNDDRAGFFQRRIVPWGLEHGRWFPWRATRDPYQLLVAEMMLRRTRAQQVVPVYREFIRRFPTVIDLAGASEEEVSECLRPLGLSWRVAAFRAVAELILQGHHGEVPRDRQQLLALPGVGPYVADAVRCFAWNEPVALVDTNTVRVAGRYFGFPVHAESRRRRPVIQAIGALLDRNRPRESNLGMLDLAALVCTPRHPKCMECPVQLMCASACNLSSLPKA